MAEPADREKLIRRMAASLELTDEETAILLTAPSTHWSKVHEDMVEELRARVARLDLKAIAREVIAADPRFAEYRNLLESCELVIVNERETRTDG